MGARGAWTGSVRVRTTLAAALVVGAALVIASIALVVFLGRSLSADVRDAAATRAENVETAIRQGVSPDLEAGEADEEFVQVLDDDGTVVLSSENVDGLPALARPGPEESVRLDQVPFEDGAFLVVGVRAAPPDASMLVVVGRNLDDVGEATSTAAALLLLGVPVLVVVVGLVTWWITGRALRPVESIRTRVETISGGALDRRVPEPATGDEIAHLATTMNRMLDRLQASQVQQRRFVSDAAHELRSPVASIRQHSEVVISHPDSTTAEELAGVVHRENLRVERLVDDLLLLARLDESARSYGQSVDLDDIVLAEAARLRVVTSLTVQASAVAPARVQGHLVELERLVRNLVENAARHARNSIDLSLTDEGGRAVLRVDDDGPGVPADDRERVFDRFVRLDASRSRDGGGAGLGLAIVRTVAEAHGGSAVLQERPGGGARVEVVLPSVRP